MGGDPNTPEDFYVSVSGDDQNPGTEALPFRTIYKAGSKSNLGYTIYIRDGTYAESITNIPSGVTLKNYTGENPVIQPPASSGYVLYEENTSGVVANGLVLDATNVTYDCVKVTGTSVNCQLLNSEIKNAPGQGVLNGGAANGLIIDNCHIHHNGTSAQLDHGVYSGQTGIIIRNCEIDHNASRGLHFWAGPDYATIDVHNNYIHDNGAQGIGCYYGRSTIVNNVIRRNPYGIMLMYDPAYSLVANNTCTEATNADIEISTLGANAVDLNIINNACFSDGSKPFGIVIAPSTSATGTINVKNNLSDGHSTNDYLATTPEGAIVPTLSDNQWDVEFTPITDDTADVIDPGVGNPVIGTGLYLSNVLTDYAGVSRSNPPSIGAYE